MIVGLPELLVLLLYVAVLAWASLKAAGTKSQWPMVLGSILTFILIAMLVASAVKGRMGYAEVVIVLVLAGAFIWLPVKAARSTFLWLSVVGWAFIFLDTTMACALIGSVGWQFSNGVRTDTQSPHTTTVADLLRMGDRGFNGRFSVGGDVESGSIKRVGNSIQFVLVQGDKRLTAIYTGVDPLPDAFRDGTQVFVDGKLGRDGVFRTTGVHLRR